VHYSYYPLNGAHTYNWVLPALTCRNRDSQNLSLYSFIECCMMMQFQWSEDLLPDLTSNPWYVICIQFSIEFCIQCPDLFKDSCFFCSAFISTLSKPDMTYLFSPHSETPYKLCLIIATQWVRISMHPSVSPNSIVNVSNLLNNK
jgi:hypothetical protein